MVVLFERAAEFSYEQIRSRKAPVPLGSLSRKTGSRGEIVTLRGRDSTGAALSLASWSFSLLGVSVARYTEREFVPCRSVAPPTFLVCRRAACYRGRLCIGSLENPMLSMTSEDCKIKVCKVAGTSEHSNAKMCKVARTSALFTSAGRA